MTDVAHQEISLGDAAAGFLAGLSSKAKEESQQEVGRFVRWYGTERPMAGLVAHEIESYAEQMSCSDTDYARKLELIWAFLAQAKKAGWTKTNMGVHLKTKKKAGPKGTSRHSPRLSPSPREAMTSSRKSSPGSRASAARRLTKYARPPPTRTSRRMRLSTPRANGAATWKDASRSLKRQ